MVAPAEPEFVIELACCESVLENEIKMGLSQKQVAETYAMALCSSWPTDWKRMNAAILAKWPNGLERVKTLAWKILETKGRSR